jgi:hypothetical protein
MIDGSHDNLLNYDFDFEVDHPDSLPDHWGLVGSHQGDSPILQPLNDTCIGDPDGSGHIWQTTGFTCAVVAQEMVLHEFGVLDPSTGQPISEAQLTYDAVRNGWLDAGTDARDMGNLLQFYGIDCHPGEGLENMIKELSQGHMVIAAVDADELWDPDNRLLNDLKDIFGGEAGNHALVVKGVRIEDSGDYVVVVNDPGRPDGAGNQYPIEVFSDAFRDSGCRYVAAAIAPPSWRDMQDNRFSSSYAQSLGELFPQRTIESLSATARQELLRGI